MSSDGTPQQRAAAQAQQQAAWTHGRLSNFAQRLQQGSARPGELTRIFMKTLHGPGGDPNQACFAHVASQAVRRKYEHAGLLGVVRHLDDFERVLQQDGNERGVYALADGFLGGRRVRLGQHASRRTCTDTDLFACCQGYLTEWIFQCPGFSHQGAGRR